VRGPTLGIAAADIMRAAMDEAKHPKVPGGYLMERKRDDGAGHFGVFWIAERLDEQVVRPEAVRAADQHETVARLHGDLIAMARGR
jgi:hypothetical protein